MRPGPVFLLCAALLLPSMASSGDQWRVSRVWNPAVNKSLDLSPQSSVKSRAEIVPPGRLSLNLGCNDISAKGLRPDGTALFEAPMQTKMGCPPDLAALETFVLGALKLIRSHERTGNEMILRDGNGREVLALVR
jgi:heat shock protein HslJ